MSEHESDGDFLARVGTDGELWAREFLKRVKPAAFDDADDALDTVRAWFANAIEAGRTAGYSQAKRENDPGWPVSAIDRSMALPDEPWTPYVRDDEPLTYGRAIGEALGAASVCWEHPEAAGVFDSERASWVLDGVLAALGVTHDQPITERG